jgi:threonyl-tRNA synthetase
MLIIGDLEVAQQQVAVRLRNGNDLGGFSLAALEQRLQKEVADKS